MRNIREKKESIFSFGKRGDIGIEEVVKIIIAIAVLIILVVLFTTLMKVITGNLKADQAKNTLNNLVYEIEKLKDGQEKEFLVEGPVGWFLWTNQEKLCFFPYSCLKTTALSKNLDFNAFDAQLLSNCPTEFCNNIGKIDIPYNSIYFEGGTKIGLILQKYTPLGFISYYIPGSSLLTQVDMDKSILIGGGDISMPQQIKLRKAVGTVNLIHIPDGEKYLLMNNLIEQINSLNLNEKKTFNFEEAVGKYLISADNDKILCLCDKAYDKDHLNECDKNGLCIFAEVSMKLSGNSKKDYLEIASSSKVLTMEKVGSDASVVTISNPKAP